jgi:hypothetical protein
MAVGVVVALVAAMPARAQDISIKDIAETERAEQDALKKVEAAHGNKPPQELSTQERAQIAHEQQDASGSALEQRSVDRKEFAKRVMRLSPAERAQVNAEKTRMDQEEKQRLARDAAAAAEPQELVITRGVDEKHPVDVYRAPGEPEIEHLSDGSGGEEGPPAKPSKSQKSQKSHKPPRGSGATQKSIRGHKSRRK